MVDQYPRVVSLRYRIESLATHEYAREAAYDGEIRGFSVRLRCRDAVFTPHGCFAREEDALSALEPLLRAWELDTALNHGPGVLRFKFIGAHVQQDAPRPGVIQMQGAASVAFAGTPTLTLTHNHHPAPPQYFVADEFVATLGDLYLLARETPRTLLYIAYSTLTCVELYCEGLANASTRLGISQNVFTQVARLANERGVGAEARKFKQGVHREPLSRSERAWLTRVLKIMVQRSGIAAAGGPVGEQVTLKSMPLPT